jgi:carnosine N-methyltransferase
LLHAIDTNAELANAIAQYSVDFFSAQGFEEQMRQLENAVIVPTNEEKAITRSAIRQVWRDWSFEATAERNSCFAPILEDITQRYSGRDRSSVKILIPGSGLNRLGFNISRAGYNVEANEVSYIHLLATNFILSRTNNGRGTCLREGFLGNIETTGARSAFGICPWAFSFSNHLKTEHQFTRYTVPEINPSSSTYLGSPPTLNLHANNLEFQTSRLVVNSNNFITDYTGSSTAGQYDVVITCFFIDTAPNFLSYVRTVKHVLKPGGTWINIGPLLWNCFENGPGGRREGDIDIDEDAQARQQLHPLRPMHQDPSEQWDRKLEFSHEEVIAILKEMGFVVRQDRDVGTAGYCFDTRGMMITEYKLRFWVAVECKIENGNGAPAWDQAIAQARTRTSRSAATGSSRPDRGGVDAALTDAALNFRAGLFSAPAAPSTVRGRDGTSTLGSVAGFQVFAPARTSAGQFAAPAARSPDMDPLSFLIDAAATLQDAAEEPDMGEDRFTD